MNARPGSYILMAKAGREVRGHRISAHRDPCGDFVPTLPPAPLHRKISVNLTLSPPFSINGRPSSNRVRLSTSNASVALLRSVDPICRRLGSVSARPDVGSSERR